MQYLVTAAILLSSLMPCLAQAECNLTVADLPEIHGVRLGRSRREVERVYAFTPTSMKYMAAERQSVKHLEAVWLDFYQDSLATVEFDYDRGTEWKNAREFAAHLEHALKLPFDSWVFVDRTEAVMKCHGFNASISSVRNTFSLTDTFAKTAAKQNLARTQKRMRVADQKTR